MRQPVFAPAVSSCQTASRCTLFAPLFPKSTPNMFNSLHRLRHCRSVVITLQWVMTRSSITHLIVHTSCASRPVSILPPARYHLLPPRIPQLAVRRTLSILSPRPRSLRLGIDPHPDNSSILDICTYVSGCPSSTPCSPSSPTHPPTPHLQRDITRSNKEALPTGRRGKRHADVRFHSSLSNSNGLGECARSSEGENKREGGLRERPRGTE